uniref:centrosomal protein of 120 kDa isoform X2 n=1 Tax=Myxine glutinosa TaxID=7769 RepID=UPI00358EFD77
MYSTVYGRGFPRRPRCHLVLEAKFDGESLSTDPVEHSNNPEIATELAWELDRKALHQHRLQRTPIKLQCFAVDKASSAKEYIGYVVLDLRPAQEKPTPPRWFPLLRSKYSKTHAELRVSLTLEVDVKNQPSFRAKAAAPRSTTARPPEALTPELDEDEGCFNIGPASQRFHLFILSVTIRAAENLQQLLSGDVRLPMEKPLFCFRYKILGNDIQNEPFGDLLRSTFPPERAVLRIRSSFNVLRSYFGAQPPLKVQLCCGNWQLGIAEIPLSNLLRGWDPNEEPAMIEGTFPLFSPDKAGQDVSGIPSSIIPLVKVVLTLKKEGTTEQQKTSDAHSEEKFPEVEERDHLVEPDALRLGDEKEPPSVGQNGTCPALPARQVSPSHLPPGPTASRGKPASTDSEIESLEEDACIGTTRAGESKPDHKMPGPDPSSGSMQTSSPKVVMRSTTHHFCFAINLSSIRDLAIDFPVNCVLRYSYRFFGSAAPIMTNPPVEVRRHTEVFLPQSYCLFEFAATLQELQETFHRVPLLVELWHRDRTARDELLGVAHVPLSSVLDAENACFLRPSGEQSWRQSHSMLVPILSTSGTSRKVAELNCSLTLEDHGPVKLQGIVCDSSDLQPTEKKPTKTPEAAAGPRQTVEYQAALELEMWKDMQERLFESQLKEKEVEHMQTLAEEWKRQHKEREALVMKKVAEYMRLEEHLRTTLAGLEKRDKDLSAAEHKMEGRQWEVEAERRRFQSEHELALKQVKESCKHQIELERVQRLQLEEAKVLLQKQLHEAEQRMRTVEKDFQRYREQQNGKPEARLQSDINLLTLEKVELERKLESAIKSKLHYKQQWSRALKELARFKQREQENALTRLRKQQDELEHLRLRYLAAEEREVVRTDQQDLEVLKNELNRMKITRTQDGETSDRAQATHGAPHTTTTTIVEEAPGQAVAFRLNRREREMLTDDEVRESLSRLIEERDTLLRTGVYTHEDRIVAELDGQIRELMVRPGA